MSYFLAKAVLLHFFGLYTSCFENMDFLLNLCSLIGYHGSQSKLFRHTKILHSPRPAIYRLHIFGLNSLKNRQSSLQQLKFQLLLADLYWPACLDLYWAACLDLYWAACLDLNSGSQNAALHSKFDYALHAKWPCSTNRSSLVYGKRFPRLTNSVWSIQMWLCLLPRWPCSSRSSVIILNYTTRRTFSFPPFASISYRPLHFSQVFIFSSQFLIFSCQIFYLSRAGSAEPLCHTVAPL